MTSEPQMPDARTRTRISPAAMGGVSRSSMRMSLLLW
jgi:hypothetical protein